MAGDRHDLAHDRGELAAGHDRVVQVVVGRQPPHRAERALAGRPVEVSLLLRARGPHLARAVAPAEGVDGPGRGREDFPHPLHLDEEHGAGIEGEPGVNGRLHGLHGQLVDHFQRRGTDPRGDDLGDRLARLLDRREDAEHRQEPLAAAHQPDGNGGDDAERALRPDDEAREVEPGLVRAAPAELHHRSVGQHQLEAEHVVRRDPERQGMDAAAVVRHVPADAARRLAARIGRKKVPARLHGRRDVQVDDAGLDDGVPVVQVDVQDTLHPGERHDDAADRGDRSPREPGAGAAGDHRHAVAARNRDDPHHLVPRERANDEVGQGGHEVAAIVLVGDQIGRMGEDVVGPHDLPQGPGQGAPVVDAAAELGELHGVSIA